MELQGVLVPDWLDNIFLKKIFQEKFIREVEIHEFTVEPATKSGDNFTTNLFRLKVSSSIGDFCLIVKKGFDSAENIMKPYDIFGREIRFYKEYLPELCEILKSIDEFEELAPELFYSDIEKELIIMKDLRIDNYSTVDRENRVSRAGAEIMLQKLAKLHASSIICNRRGNGHLEKIKYHVFHTKGVFQDVSINHIKAFLEAVKTWGSDFAPMIPKLEYILEHYLELADIPVSAAGRFNVLGHNDLWFNNLLFKNDISNGPIDILFIDFQLTSWTSLATDLIVFFYTSLNEEDYQENFTDLIAVYQKNLERILKKCNADFIPTVGDILKEVKDRHFHGRKNIVMQ